MEIFLTFGFPAALFLVGIYLVLAMRRWVSVTEGSRGQETAREREAGGPRSGEAQAGVVRESRPGRFTADFEADAKQEAEELRRSLKGK